MKKNREQFPYATKVDKNFLLVKHDVHCTYDRCKNEVHFWYNQDYWCAKHFLNVQKLDFESMNLK